MSTSFVDLLVVISANIFNLVIVGVMLARIPGLKKLERAIGLLDFILVIPLGFAAIFNLTAVRPWWMVLFPALLAFYLLVEILLDYIFKFPFRQTRWLGPYLGLFYLAQWMMIGYAFGVDRRYGFVTLATYFISLGTTAVSYKKVGHGNRISNPDLKPQ